MDTFIAWENSLISPDEKLIFLTSTELTNSIDLTPSATAKLQSLSEKEGRDSLVLRVYVTGGGCSGLQYGFSLGGVYQEDDTEIKHEGISLIVDSLSFQYLIGSEVDYQEDLAGSRFTVKNPNATSTCGCGLSFSI